MAKNIRQGSVNLPVTRVGVIPTFPTVAIDGGMTLFGQLAGVAESTADALNGIVPLNLDCIAELVVQGVNGGGNVTVVAGDIVYASLADPVVCSKVATGVRVGIAFGNALTDTGADTRTGTLVASGNTTTTIRVLVGH